jgi:hypothetical protein
MYYPDNSIYCYKVYKNPNLKRIGWLDVAKPYAYGRAQPEIEDILWEYCKTTLNEWRGHHSCTLCPSSSSRNILVLERNGERVELGSDEIVVLGLEGKVFICPNLIFHYVRDHGYSPPYDFLAAVAKSPPPPSDIYFRSVRALNFNCKEHRPIQLLNRLVANNSLDTAKTLEHYVDNTIFNELAHYALSCKYHEIRKVLVRCFAKIKNPQSLVKLNELACDESIREECLEAIDYWHANNTNG